MKYEEFLFTGTGRRVFVLSENSILVTGRGLNVTLLLRGLEPEYRTIRQRTPAFYVGLVFLCLGLVGLAVFPVSNPQLSDPPWSLESSIWIFAVVSILFGLPISCVSWRKVEYAIFRNTTGVDTISIARAGPDSASFDLFVAEVSRGVRQAKCEAPAMTDENDGTRKQVEGNTMRVPCGRKLKIICWALLVLCAAQLIFQALKCDVNVAEEARFRKRAEEEARLWVQLKYKEHATGNFCAHVVKRLGRGEYRVAVRCAVAFGVPPYSNEDSYRLLNASDFTADRTEWLSSISDDAWVPIYEEVENKVNIGAWVLEGQSRKSEGPCPICGKAPR